MCGALEIGIEERMCGADGVRSEFESMYPEAQEWKLGPVLVFCVAFWMYFSNLVV